MQDLINSFIRLSAAMTVYSTQQIQSALDTVETQNSVVRLKKIIDSMTEALTSQLDEAKRNTVESLSNRAADVVELLMKPDRKSSASAPQAAGEVLVGEVLA